MTLLSAATRLRTEDVVDTAGVWRRLGPASAFGGLTGATANVAGVTSNLAVFALRTDFTEGALPGEVTVTVVVGIVGFVKSCLGGPVIGGLGDGATLGEGEGEEDPGRPLVLERAAPIDTVEPCFAAVGLLG